MASQGEGESSHAIPSTSSINHRTRDNRQHQSFEEFLSQFNAHASLQQSTTVSHEVTVPHLPSGSVLKATAAEFVPSWQKSTEMPNDGQPTVADQSAKVNRNGPRDRRDGPYSNDGASHDRRLFSNPMSRNVPPNQPTSQFPSNRRRFYDTYHDTTADPGSSRQEHQENWDGDAGRGNNGRWKKYNDGNSSARARNGYMGHRNAENSYYQGEHGANRGRNGRQSSDMKNGGSGGVGAYKASRSAKQKEKQEEKIISKCSQRDKLIRELDSSRLECLVCCETIRPTQSVWSCPNCYHILHLGCTTKWASSASSKADEDGWRCPACQNVSKRIPRQYYCFCGKQKNPVYNRSDVAHSCGELCARIEQCEHSCTLLCHPGPCPPCQALVQRRCGCGNSTKPMQCSQKEDLVCGERCGKLLNCGLHCCEQTCHPGECAGCERSVQHECFCGKEKKEVLCNEETRMMTRFSCGAVCDALLECKNHRCAKVCHEGNCGECNLSPEIINTCPCGKQNVAKDERSSCLDPIPLCKATCGRQLVCGVPGAHHTCAARCHHGECPPCNKSTVVKCRCGHMDQQMKCKLLKSRADDARCKKKCNRMRSCAKHKCNQECCIDLDHVCPKLCAKQLSCGRHRCDKPCHKGSCQICHRVSFEELTCECGAAVIFPPVPCGTKKPPCDKPCSRRHACSHPVLHKCHSDAACTPCVVLTTQYCYGKHEQRKTIPCYQNSFSCGLPCAKALPCGRHRCIKPCHESEQCLAEGEECKQSCTNVRVSCGHQCKVPCHDGDCPVDVPCKETIEVSCECGNRKQARTCHEFSKEYRRIASAQLASSMQQLQNGGTVELSDILTSSKPKSTKTLECSEECRRLERNRRLAIALQIRNPDLSSKLQPNYSEFLKTLAKKDPNLMKMIHEKLTELVKLAKESKQSARSYSFPVMNRDKRRAVHEMCTMFGVESVSYDAEPNRNVVATADRFKSWLPSMSLLEVIQRENGQRRVVLPNLNAWGRTANGDK